MFYNVRRPLTAALIIEYQSAELVGLEVIPKGQVSDNFANPRSASVRKGHKQ
ncbi:MAG: hypothetical protein ABIG63_16435 [Chloroflexota bacterium]